MVRVRRTSNGKSQPGPILVHFMVATLSTQCHGEDSIWLEFRPVRALHANRKTNGHVTTPKACNVSYRELGMEVRLQKKISPTPTPACFLTHINTATPYKGNEE